MVTTKHKPTVDIQMLNRGEFKHSAMKNRQFTKENSKRGRKVQRKYKNPETSKMTFVSNTYQ